MITYDFHIIRFTPDILRNETINVGLVVFRENGIDVFTLKDDSKLKALTNDFNLKDLNKFASILLSISSKLTKEDLLFLYSKNSIRLSDGGYFQIERQEQYLEKVEELMDKIVNPPH